MNARYYDPVLGSFISPDTVVPEPGQPEGYNRYAYANGNPLRFSDPSGHDPLDKTWEEEFEQAHGRAPTDDDRRDRLFSVMVMGNGAGGTWTEADWQYYASDRASFWNSPSDFEPTLPLGIISFVEHTRRLATYYKVTEHEQFVKAFAFVFASYPMGDPALSTIDMISPSDNFQRNPMLLETNDGWDPALLQKGDNSQSHHYAAFVYMGYFFGPDIARAANYLRDGICDCGPFQKSSEDVLLGDIAAYHGHWIFTGSIPINNLDLLMWFNLSKK